MSKVLPRHRLTLVPYELRSLMEYTVEGQRGSTSDISDATHRKVSPFGYRRINACSAAPRRFSQPATSFFGIFSQGIHHVPFMYPENRTSSLELAVSLLSSLHSIALPVSELSKGKPVIPLPGFERRVA